MRNKNRISTTLKIFGGRMFAVAALFTIATVGTAFADNSITKTFEFGLGQAYTHSNVRTFPIPCGTVGGIAAVVKFQRLGPDGAGNNIPIIIELREPDTATDQEGPIADTKNATAKKTEQTVTLRSPSSNRGCSLPWRVRVNYANDGTAPVKVYGTIRLDFDGRARNFPIEDLCISKGGVKTVNIGGFGGFEQGTIEIKPNPINSILCPPGPPIVIGPNSIKLKLQLIDPSGAVKTTKEGYFRDDNTAYLFYRVKNRVPGQWKLEITNLNTGDDTKIYGYSLREFTPDCP